MRKMILREGEITVVGRGQGCTQSDMGELLGKGCDWKTILTIF